MGEHLINGEFQSDKYPETPRGFVPLKCSDGMAQDLLWTYAQRRRHVDKEFADDLEQALLLKGFDPVGGDRVPALEVEIADALERWLVTVMKERIGPGIKGSFIRDDGRRQPDETFKIEDMFMALYEVAPDAVVLMLKAGGAAFIKDLSIKGGEAKNSP